MASWDLLPDGTRVIFVLLIRENSSPRFCSQKMIYWAAGMYMCSVSGVPHPLSSLQRSGGLSSSPGTWPVALETLLCASGISALRHHISHARVSTQLPTYGVLTQWRVADSLSSLVPEEERRPRAHSSPLTSS